MTVALPEASPEPSAAKQRRQDSRAERAAFAWRAALIFVVVLVSGCCAVLGSAALQVAGYPRVSGAFLVSVLLADLAAIGVWLRSEWRRA